MFLRGLGVVGGLYKPLNLYRITSVLLCRRNFGFDVWGVLCLAEMIERVLDASLGKTVLIKLRGGRTLRGTLEGFDQHVNLVLKDAENVSDPSAAVDLGTIVLRGDNVIMISPPPA